MNIIIYLKQFIYCYNHCKIHEYSSKLKIKNYLEEIGINFICYKGKLYIKDIEPNPKYLDDEDIYSLESLQEIIKEANNLYKSKINIVTKYKNDGFYFKDIKGNLYFEKAEPYETITSFNYNNYKDIPHYEKYKKIYQEYKKNV
jgi:DNA-binding protein YbaB